MKEEKSILRSESSRSVTHLQRVNKEEIILQYRPVTYLQKVNKMYHKTRQYIHKYFRDRPEPPLNLRVVPLPKFTIHNIEKKNAHIGFFDTLKKLFVHTYLIKVEDEKVYS